MKMTDYRKAVPAPRICCFLLACLLMPLTALAEEAVAMITDLQGTAAISVGGKQQPAEILAYLRPNSEMQVEADAKLNLVYFDSGKEYTYVGPARIRLEAAEPKLLSGKAGASQDLVILQETGLRPAQDRSFAQGVLVLRGVNDNKKVKVLSPLNTKVLESRPEFRWQGPNGPLKYHFSLFDDAGLTLVETDVQGQSFMLQEDIELQPGAWYSWQVEVRLSDGKYYSGEADFSRPEQSELDLLNKLRPAKDAPFAERVVYATVLEQMGVVGEALRQWEQLAAERPDAAALKARIQK